jgi:hypothetical protein
MGFHGQALGHDELDRVADELRGQRGDAPDVVIAKPNLDRQVAALRMTEAGEASAKCVDEGFQAGGSLGREPADPGDLRRLLRARGHRPDERCSERRDERAPLHVSLFMVQG